MDLHPRFEWPEYCVFGSVLGISVAIGIYYGFFGGKNKTNEEYLLGNRQMNPIHVALSLVVSNVSSITLLGHPVEIYRYGTQLFMIIPCFIPLTLTLIYIFVPFYFRLQLTSIYQFIEWRFSARLRTFLSIVYTISSLFFMSMAVLGPALALSLVTGINHHVLVAIFFGVAIFYSCLGGIKAVLWTDAIQALIMIVSMGIVVGIGIYKIGGMSIVWERALDTDRIHFFSLDPDPRTRHTFWTGLIGGYFNWLAIYNMQPQIQRYISLPSLRAVSTALIINMFGLSILLGVCYLGGLVMYSTYYDCDPYTIKSIQAVDQLLIHFMMDTVGEYPGLPGLFVAGLTCASLSTVSTILNSLPANIVEDFIRKLSPKLTDKYLLTITKLISLLTGLVAFGFVFIAEQMGSLFSVALTVLGVLGGPSFGVFVSGMFFPWVNTVGAICGLGISIGFMGVLGIGSTIYNNRKLLPNQILSLDTRGCGPHVNGSLIPSNEWKWNSRDDDILTQILSLSNNWYPAVGCVLTVILALVFSFILSKLSKQCKDEPKSSKLFIPIFLKMWNRICPEITKRYVIFEEDKDKESNCAENILLQSMT